MSNKTKFIAVSVTLGFLVFIGIAIYTNLFSGAELPVLISGALLEAVVTALITYFLLAGQTGQEEVKERNVKVFEEKSLRFNRFINKLWEVWDDHSVDLNELNELIKMASQEIILFAHPQTASKILSCLIEIAKQANPYETDSNNTEKGIQPDADQPFVWPAQSSSTAWVSNRRRIFSSTKRLTLSATLDMGALGNLKMKDRGLQLSPAMGKRQRRKRPLVQYHLRHHTLNNDFLPQKKI